MSRPSSVARSRALHDTRGAVYVEFLIAFLPIFTMVLGLVQMSLVFAGHIAVKHASVAAARAAIVVLPDDPRLYNGAPLNSVAQGAQGGGDSPLDAFLRLITGGSSAGLGRIPILGQLLGLSLPGGSGAGQPQNVYNRKNARYTAIHDAASIPMLAVSPTVTQFFRGTFSGRDEATVLDAIGPDPLVRAATGALFYNKVALAVTFPTGPGATSYTNSFGDAYGPVTVRVTYAMHCAVPIARKFLCSDPLSLRFGASPEARAIIDSVTSSPSVTGVIAANIALGQLAARQASANAGMAELEANSGSLALLASFRQRYRILREEVTLPLQGAGYQYHAPMSGGGSGGSGGGGGG